MRLPSRVVSNTSERMTTGRPLGSPARARSTAMTASSRRSSGKWRRKLRRCVSWCRPSMMSQAASIPMPATPTRPTISAWSLLMLRLARGLGLLFGRPLALKSADGLNQGFHQTLTVDGLAADNFQTNLVLTHDHPLFVDIPQVMHRCIGNMTKNRDQFRPQTDPIDEHGFAAMHHLLFPKPSRPPDDEHQEGCDREQDDQEGHGRGEELGAHPDGDARHEENTQ